MKLYFIIWYLIAAFTSALQIIFIKKYTDTKSLFWVILSILSACIMLLSYVILVVNNNITIIYPIIKVLSIVFVSIIGFFAFNNKIDTKSFIGILFGIVSIFLLSHKT
jgi:multidrug transporter EmrE-like cation transporter